MTFGIGFLLAAIGWAIGTWWALRPRKAKPKSTNEFNRLYCRTVEAYLKGRYDEEEQA